jgi:gustatory receptor
LQIIWLFLALLHAMMMDTMFCCWLIYTCQQLIHLKEIMKPLMELSASLDTLVPHSAELFRAVSATANNPIPSGDYNASNYLATILKTGFMKTNYVESIF